MIYIVHACSNKWIVCTCVFMCRCTNTLNVDKNIDMHTLYRMALNFRVSKFSRIADYENFSEFREFAILSESTTHYLTPAADGWNLRCSQQISIARAQILTALLMESGNLPSASCVYMGPGQAEKTVRNRADYWSQSCSRCYWITMQQLPQGPTTSLKELHAR